jgi:hypothetical protein
MRVREPGFTCGNFQVPVIAVFTKYDQFKREIWISLEDQGRDPRTNLKDEAESIFQQHYLAILTGPPPFVRLEGEKISISYYTLC